MKTIATPNRNFGRILFALAALGGLYYLRRSGKSTSEILSLASGGIKSARDLVLRTAPPIAESAAASAQI